VGLDHAMQLASIHSLPFKNLREKREKIKFPANNAIDF
jgi:hypothetical protein